MPDFPKVIPKAIHDELVKRKMSAAYDLLADNVLKAVEVLVEVACDPKAEAGVRMIEWGAARKVMPWTAAVLLTGFGWLPRPIFHAISRLFGVSRSMASWRGH